MRHKWLIAGALGLAELAVLAGIIVAAQGGLTWQKVFGLAWSGFSLERVSATDDQDQTFTVGPAATLDVQGVFGAVTVTGGSGQVIAVHAHKTGWGSDQAAAQAALAALKVTLSQTGQAVTVKVEAPPGGVLVNPALTASVDFTVEVPAATGVTAHTRFGDVQVAGVTGGVDAASNNGRASAHDVGGAIQLRSDFGMVTLENAAVSTVTAHSNSGAVKLSQVTASGPADLQSEFGSVQFLGGGAASLAASSSNGSVTLTGLTIAGQVTAHSDFGSLTLSQVAAAGYTATSNNGNVSIDGAAGSVTAHSDFGRVSVTHAAGATLDLHSSNGAVSFSGSLGAGPHSLTSDFGDVQLALPANTAAEVDLTTSFGHIHSTLPVTASGDLGQAHWAGVLNGGGPRLTVKTSNGNISLDALGS